MVIFFSLFYCPFFSKVFFIGFMNHDDGNESPFYKSQLPSAAISTLRSRAPQINATLCPDDPRWPTVLSLPLLIPDRCVGAPRRSMVTLGWHLLPHLSHYGENHLPIASSPSSYASGPCDRISWVSPPSLQAPLLCAPSTRSPAPSCAPPTLPSPLVCGVGV